MLRQATSEEKKDSQQTSNVESKSATEIGSSMEDSSFQLVELTDREKIILGCADTGDISALKEHKATLSDMFILNKRLKESSDEDKTMGLAGQFSVIERANRNNKQVILDFFYSLAKEDKALGEGKADLNGNTLAHYMVLCNQESDFSAWLKDKNLTGMEFTHLLRLSIWMGNTNLTAKLFKTKHDVVDIDRARRDLPFNLIPSPLYMAIIKKDKPSIELLLKEGANPCKLQIVGKQTQMMPIRFGGMIFGYQPKVVPAPVTPVWEVLREEDLVPLFFEIESFQKQLAELLANDEYGRQTFVRLFDSLSSRVQSLLFNFLLEHKIKKAIDDLFIRSLNFNENYVSLYLQHDHLVDANAICPDDGIPVLHHAVTNGQEGVARYLLRNGADINFISEMVGSPLHVSIHEKLNSKMALLLLDDENISYQSVKQELDAMPEAIRSADSETIRTHLNAIKVYLEKRELQLRPKNLNKTEKSNTLVSKPTDNIKPASQTSDGILRYGFLSPPMAVRVAPENTQDALILGPTDQSSVVKAGPTKAPTSTGLTSNSVLARPLSLPTVKKASKVRRRHCCIS